MPIQPLVLSFEVATLATLLAAVVGVALAAWIADARFRGRDVVDALVTAPLVMPPTVLGYYLLVVLGRRSPIGAAFEHLTGGSIVFSRTGAVVAATVGALPLVVRSARAALEGVDPTLVQAARTLGATPARAFFTVRLPLAGRGVLAGVLLAFARSLGDFGVTLMLAGDIPGETRTASLAIYDAIEAHRDAEAAALAITLTILAVCVLYAVGKLGGRP
ncbi:MAG TPA: molybdate ABC transporter permease subunit [Byssovorax sp.]